MRIRVSVLAGLALVGITTDLHAQANDPGRQVFESRCARCHGADGNGGEMGPPIVTRLPPLDDEQLAKVIRDGVPAKGMPPNIVDDPEMALLVKFLRTIQKREEAAPVVRMKVQTTDGRSLDGQVIGEGFDDLQLRTGILQRKVLSLPRNRIRSPRAFWIVRITRGRRS